MSGSYPEDSSSNLLPATKLKGIMENKALKNEELKIGDEWQTPPDLWEDIKNWFPFVGPIFDPCPGSVPLAGCYSPEGVFNGLEIPWGALTFVNPPFSNIHPWVEKALDESYKGKHIVMLLPVRSDQHWFYLLKEEAKPVFIRGRVQYVTEGQARKNCSFASMLVVLEGRYPKEACDYWWPICHREREKRKGRKDVRKA